MATPLISKKNLVEIEKLVKVILKESEEQISELSAQNMSENMSDMARTFNMYLILRDILHLSYGMDIRDFQQNDGIKVDEETSNAHFLQFLENTFTVPGMSTSSLADDLYFEAEARNGTENPFVNHILDNIIEKETKAFSLKKAKEFVGKRIEDRIITGKEVFDIVVENLYNNFLKTRKKGRGLLTFKALLKITNDLDIFAEFYVPHEAVEEYRQSILHDGTNAYLKKHQELNLKLYAELTSGEKARIDDPNYFHLIMEEFGEKGKQDLEKAFPEECKELKKLAKKTRKLRQINEEKYSEQLTLLNNSLIEKDGRVYFSSEKAKEQTQHQTALFNVFSGLRRCYLR